MGREAKGMTTREFADRIGVSHQMVSKYENGQSMPTPSLLDKMILELNLPFRFFLKPLNENITGKPVFFRSRAISSKKLKKIHEIKLEWLIEVQHYLDNILDFPSVNLPSNVKNNSFFQPLDFEDIDEIAMQLREAWGLNAGPISNLILLMEKNGIVVSKVTMADIKIDACSAWDKQGRPFILLGNNKRSFSRSRFDLAHELGHLILHRHLKLNEFNDKKIYNRLEEEADYFASSFLLPKESFMEEFISSSLEYFISMKKRWKLSIQALVYRASSLNLISDNQKSYLWRQISSKGWRKGEPFEPAIEEIPVLLKQAFDLIIEHQVKSKNQLAEEISLNIEEIESLANLDEGFLREVDEFVNLDNIIRLK
ncbi:MULTISPECIES: helix-turn-helix domain-containing protein [Bacillus subtilis group]|uniref:helix-turn-helix domain-containing protein n=1 Tax=Bacillus subtilis group TaxID=653685 RepID=UPI000F53F1AA|nr:ImmA/IrrE family metallo-endopeptidase [Bacillus subtilis]